MTFEELEFLRESNNIENEWGDMALQQAIVAWQFLQTQEELTDGCIRKAHKILMLHSNIRPNEKGYYRERNVAIGGTRIVGIDGDKIIRQFVKIADVLPFKEIKQAMSSWIEKVNMDIHPVSIKTLGKENLAIVIKDDHIKFEHIHPFIDGNGRIGRMLLNWQRARIGLPILVIYEKDKEEYYQWFKK